MILAEPLCAVEGCIMQARHARGSHVAFIDERPEFTVRVDRGEEDDRPWVVSVDAPEVMDETTTRQLAAVLLEAAEALREVQR